MSEYSRRLAQKVGDFRGRSKHLACIVISSNKVSIYRFQPPAKSVDLACGAVAGRQIQGGYSVWQAGPRLVSLVTAECRIMRHGLMVRMCAVLVALKWSVRADGNINMTHETWKLKSPVTHDRLICL